MKLLKRTVRFALTPNMATLAKREMRFHICHTVGCGTSVPRVPVALAAQAQSTAKANAPCEVKAQAPLAVRAPAVRVTGPAVLVLRTVRPAVSAPVRPLRINHIQVAGPWRDSSQNTQVRILFLINFVLCGDILILRLLLPV